MANAKANFVLPTSGTGVNAPSITASWNGATYQVPIQASIAEVEAAHIGGAPLNTGYQLLSALGLTSDNVQRGYRLINPDAAIEIRLASTGTPGTSYATIKPGTSIEIPWNRVKDLYVAAASGTPRIEWVGC